MWNGKRSNDEDGVYVARLGAIWESDRPGKSGYQFWVWEFDDLCEAETRRLAGPKDVLTSLSPKAHWKLKEIFEAFEESPHIDTDELIGRQVGLELRGGEVRRVLPLVKR